MRDKKFRLRNMRVTRVDLVDKGANQDAHIVLAKAFKEKEDEKEKKDPPPFAPKDEEAPEEDAPKEDAPKEDAPPFGESEEEAPEGEEEAPEEEGGDEGVTEDGAVKVRPDLAERIRAFLAENGDDPSETVPPEGGAEGTGEPEAQQPAPPGAEAPASPPPADGPPEASPEAGPPEAESEGPPEEGAPPIGGEAPPAGLEDRKPGQDALGAPDPNAPRNPLARNAGGDSRISSIRPEDFEIVEMNQNMMEWAVPPEQLPEGVEEASMTMVQSDETIIFQWMIDPLAGPPQEGNAKTAAEAFVAMRGALTTQGAMDPMAMLGGMPGQMPPGQFPPGKKVPGAPPVPGEIGPEPFGAQQKPPPSADPNGKPKVPPPGTPPAGLETPEEKQKKQKVQKILRTARMYRRVRKHDGPGPHQSGSEQSVHGSGGGGGERGANSPSRSRDQRISDLIDQELDGSGESNPFKVEGSGEVNLTPTDARPDTGPRPIHEIARAIRRDWGPKVNFAAKPYLDAMSDLDSIDDNFFMDSGRDVVARFLSNASTWRGDTARTVKAELRAMLKAKSGPNRIEPQTGQRFNDIQLRDSNTRVDTTLDLIVKGLVEVDVFADTATGEDLRDILPPNLLEKIDNELSAQSAE